MGCDYAQGRWKYTPNLLSSISRSQEGPQDTWSANSDKAGLCSGIWEESGCARGVTDLEGTLYLGIQNCGCVERVWTAISK